jgi:hypothetical protein
MVRVFIHPANVPAKPDDPAFAAKYQAARFVMWRMGSDHGGASEMEKLTHPPTQSIYLDVTSTYDSVTKDLPPDAELTVSLDFTQIGDGKPKKVRHGEAGIEIQAASLVVNPRPPGRSPR